MNVKKINGQQLKGMLAKKRGQFVAIFSTSWCGYCRALKKEIEAATLDFTIIEVDISDESDSSWGKFEINLVPTAILFKDGREVARKPPSPDGLRLKELRELVGRRSGSP